MKTCPPCHGDCLQGDSCPARLALHHPDLWEYLADLRATFIKGAKVAAWLFSLAFALAVLFLFTYGAS